MKTKQGVKFLLLIFTILLFAFILHCKTQEYFGDEEYSNYIIECYLLNFIITAIISNLIIFLYNKMKDSLGFLFIMASTIKFISFFLFIYPKYDIVPGLKSGEFAAFFIPYLICIVAEVIYLKKIFTYFYLKK